MSGHFSLQYGIDNLCNVAITLIDDDGFGIIVQFIFTVFDMAFEMGHDLRVQLKGAGGFFISFKYLDGIPAAETFFHLRCNGFFNMRNGMFHGTSEYGGELHLLFRFCCF